MLDLKGILKRTISKIVKTKICGFVVKICRISVICKPSKRNQIIHAKNVFQ